jgi:hypothetical protein
MWRAKEIGEGTFELADRWPKDKAGFFHYSGYRVIGIFLYGPILPL